MQTRREFVQSSSLAGALAAIGWLGTEQALAQAQPWNKAAFETKNLAEMVKALGGSAPAESKDITITAPDIAENGAVVPVGVASKIPKTQIDRDPGREESERAGGRVRHPGRHRGHVATRIKMGQSSNVYAVVKADGKYYVATKEIKVTLGGCGG